jgi:Na+-transporting NADH:ubiquinone oxidoreductase subunit A
LEITLDGQDSHQDFQNYKSGDVSSTSQEDIRGLLVESGLWSAIRSRPYDKAPAIDSVARNIFISVLDTNPLAMDPCRVINMRSDDFWNGVRALSRFAEAKTFVCYGKQIPDNQPEISNLELHQFGGKHPAGNVGTHMNFLTSVNSKAVAWHIGYQDVIEIGHLVKTGKRDPERYISFAGPRAKNPRVFKTQIGANLSELANHELNDAESTRVISGSVLNGRTKDHVFNFLGAFANQVTAIKEDNHRELLGWHKAGINKFSQKNVFVSKILQPFTKFPMGSSTHGSLRALVPTGVFEEINSLDILPTPLLKALISKDTDSAQELGCLELGEEDVALFTFASPGKIDFGKALRENLTLIEKDG